MEENIKVEETILDIANKQADPSFLFHVASEIAKGNLTVNKDLLGTLKGIDTSFVDREDVFDELNEALMNSEKPSLFFEALRDMGQLDSFFSEVKALEGVQQNPKFHPEGDAWNHTMEVLDHAAELRDTTKNPLAFMYSAVFHDIGKPEATYWSDEKENWVSIGHEVMGINIADTAMRRLTDDKKLIDYTKNMVELHMEPYGKKEAKQKSINKMFAKSIEPYDLIKLHACDAHTVSQDLIRFWNEKADAYMTKTNVQKITKKDLEEAGAHLTDIPSEVRKYNEVLACGVSRDSILNNVEKIENMLHLPAQEIADNMNTGNWFDQYIKAEAGEKEPTGGNPAITIKQEAR